MLDRLARSLHAHARAVVLAAVAGALIAAVLGGGVADGLSPYSADDAASQSVKTRQAYERATGRQIDAGVVALVTLPAGGPDTAAARAAVAPVARELAREPAVASVIGYAGTHDRAMVSRDGRRTYLVAVYRALSDKRVADASKAIERRFRGRPDIRLGGVGIANVQVNEQVATDLARAELLAFPLIFLLSLLFFRSLVAALLPPLVGGLAIVGTFAALRLVNDVTGISVFALNLVTAIGLGLAIDYTLFIVSRHREETALGGHGLAALARTLQTAGRTVVFSALTVAAALAALIVFPQSFLHSMGIGGAIVVLLAAGLALVVLPALLVVLGPRIDALAPGWLKRAAARDARRESSGPWYRLSQLVMRRPGVIAAAAALVLILLGLPFAGIRFTTVDASVLPPSASSRQVDEALSTQFPPHRNTPLRILVGAPPGAAATGAVAARLRTLPGVSAVLPAQPAGRGRSLIDVAPARGFLTGSSQDLVRRVRALDPPVPVAVAGLTAEYVDLQHSLRTHLPVVLLLIVLTTLPLLFLVTGSVVLPVKAVIMNVLTLSATLGVLVLIFQDGRGEGALAYRGQGALDITQPILLVVIGFALATDYGVLLLSRIKEARDAGAADRDAVAIGLERTGRIVTACALLFAIAMGAFATSEIVFAKELGVGTALAVLIDATIVRALLVPSLMALLGAVNWWAPRPLRRLHRRVALPPHGAPASTKTLL